MTSVSHNNLNIHNFIIMIVKPNEKELDSETMDALSSALLALTTDDSSRTRGRARELLSETSGMEGNNVLQTAILKEASDSIKMILRLIEKSGEHEVLEETNKIGLSALLIAIRTGQQDVVSLLLDSGANPDSRDRDGESAVHVAVREEDYNMLQILLKAGADPNLPSHLGKFPLHLAVDRQLEEMVRYLVKEAMVDLNREDYSGMTALTFAESCRNQNILRLISRGVRKQNK